jgi:hypothetical protein
LQGGRGFGWAEQRAGVNVQGGKHDGVFLHHPALVLEQHDDHGNADQHLRHGAQEEADAAEVFLEELRELP